MKDHAQIYINLTRQTKFCLVKYDMIAMIVKQDFEKKKVVLENGL
jgi:hypothetical protein